MMTGGRNLEHFRRTRYNFESFREFINLYQFVEYIDFFFVSNEVEHKGKARNDFIRRKMHFSTFWKFLEKFRNHEKIIICAKIDLCEQHTILFFPVEPWPH